MIGEIEVTLISASQTYSRLIRYISGIFPAWDWFWAIGQGTETHLKQLHRASLNDCNTLGHDSEHHNETKFDKTRFRKGFVYLLVFPPFFSLIKPLLYKERLGQLHWHCAWKFMFQGSFPKKEYIFQRSFSKWRL